MRGLWLFFLSAVFVSVVGCLSVGNQSSVARGATPVDEVDHLQLAASKLKSGDDAAAIRHLQSHVTVRPNAVMVRAYLAELFFKSGDVANAQKHFAWFLRDADHGGGADAKQHRIHAHTRLMELAQELDQPAAEAHHRGVGLVLLVEQWDEKSQSATSCEVETTLTQAIAALRQATQLQTHNVVAWYYLAEAQDRLGQTVAAQSTARRVIRALPDPSITPDMQMQLEEWCEGTFHSLK